MGNNVNESILPYRTTADDLIQLVEARARGRQLTQIQSLIPANNFQGTLAAAYELGLMDADTKELTAVGREYALAAPMEKRTLLLNAMCRYEPYELLLEAIFGRGQQKGTTIDWIETWWSTHNYGNSQTNREDGAFTFGKFIEFVELGSYVTGRRGHPTRIEWRDDASARVKAIIRSADSSPMSPIQGEEQKQREETSSANTPVADKARKGIMNTKPPVEGNNILVLNLDNGRIVEISIPSIVTSDEKRRLLALIEGMVKVNDDIVLSHTDTSSTTGPDSILQP